MKSNKLSTITVIGLGYVGLPLALQAKKKGFKTYGYDTNETVVENINNNNPYIEGINNLLGLKSYSSPSRINESDVVVVCVPTPINSKYLPDLKPLKKSIETIIDNHKYGQLISIESTVNPGAMEEIVKPLFDKSGLKIGKDYFLSHCPERIDPGNNKYSISNIPRVVGAFTEKGLNLAYEFYTNLIDAKITKMKTIKEAEATKIIENTFRDVNIAFFNELAKSFDKMDIDIMNVIKGASTKPFGFMPHYPGCGVGGHCIPVDPYYLIEKANEIGFNHEFLKLARNINKSMPKYTVDLVIDNLNKVKRSINGTKIGILGVSYKKNIGDIRESPSLEIIDLLRKKGADLKIYDPYVPDLSCVNKEEVLNSECIVLATDHDEFRGYNFSKTKVLIDGKNFLDKEKIEKLDVIYKGIGR